MNNPTLLKLLTGLLLATIVAPSHAALDPNDPNDPNGPRLIFVGPPERTPGMVFDRLSIDIGITQNDDPFLLWDGTGTIDVFIINEAGVLLAETNLLPPEPGTQLPIDEEFTSFASSVPCFPNTAAAGGCNLGLNILTLDDEQISADWIDTSATYPDADPFTFFRLVIGREPGLPPLTLSPTPFPVADVTVQAGIESETDPDKLVFQVYALSMCVGDADSDLDVDLSDLATVLANFGKSPATPEEGDLNGDGKVDLQDLATVLAVFGESC